MRIPKRPNGNVKFQFKGVIVGSPDRNIPSIGTRTNRPAEDKVTRIGNKILLMVPQGNNKYN